MLINTLYLLLSLTGLLWSCNLMVDHSIKFALARNISKIVIGATILGFGTSAPEIFISFIAGTKEVGDIVLANVLGSNITNICIAMGVSFLFVSCSISRSSSYIYSIFLILSLFLSYIFLRDNILSIAECFALVITAILFIYLNIHYLKDQPEEIEETKDVANRKLSSLFSLAIAISSLILMLFCAEVFIEHARLIAIKFNIEERIIGLTLVAIGTSLPEIVTSLVSLYKKQGAVAIGAIAGSNIFNLCLALPAAAITAPLVISGQKSGYDFLVTASVTAILVVSILYIAILRKNKNIAALRLTGSILVIIFLLYYGSILCT